MVHVEANICVYVHLHRYKNLAFKEKSSIFTIPLCFPSLLLIARAINASNEVLKNFLIIIYSTSFYGICNISYCSWNLYFKKLQQHT